MAGALLLDLRARDRADRSGSVVQAGGRALWCRGSERDPPACAVSGRGHDGRQNDGGDQHSHRVDTHAALILQAYEANPPIYLHKAQAMLQTRAISVSLSGLSRFFRRRGITRKTYSRPVGKWSQSISLNRLDKRIRLFGEPLAKVASRASWFL